MEQLLQFVMENLVFIVIILGVISSLLSRSKGGQPTQSGQPRQFGQPTPPGQGMPPFGQPDHGPVRQRREQPQTARSSVGPTRSETTAAQRPVKTASSSTASSRSRSLESLSQPNLTRDELRSDLMQQRTMSPSSQTAAALTSQDTTQDSIQDRTSPVYQALHDGNPQEQAIKGMVWSEILGSPRALQKRHLYRR